MLASGDPFHYGVGAVLARQVEPQETVVVPAPSAFSLAAARLGWALPETALVSLHGRDARSRAPAPAARRARAGADLRRRGTGRARAPARGSRLRRLAADGAGGARRAARARAHGDRRRSSISARSTTSTPWRSRWRPQPGARIIARAAGLADALFEHDGQITKREIRAITLSSLAPRRGELLWDVGAGAGSVAIEWMLADPSLRAIAIEARADRAARIRRNAAAFGVPGLEVVEGTAPAALAGCRRRTRSSSAAARAIPACSTPSSTALRPGGRLVVNAVTLETEALLIARHAALGGELIRIAIARASPLGGMTGWRPALPVTQWVWVKP